MRSVPFYQSTLQSEFSRRCAQNGRYSVRAFAQALQIDAGTLSRVLAGKRVPSRRMAERILRRIDLGPQDKDRFIGSLAESQQARGLRRLNPFFKNWRQMPEKSPARHLDLELFRVIADWHHYAILELTYVEGFRSDPKWIAGELGIPVNEARIAVDRLLGLGLLKEEHRAWAKSERSITTADKHVSTPALRRHQKQVLERAVESLENDPIESRSMTSMTMAIDPALLPAAREMIEAFTHAVCGLLESGARKQVYELGICLYPVQKKRRTKKEMIV